ncbi:hypothetical protein GOP47_0007879 [Adiantum capillus-veneris]|uniref:Uncharacterized protein n=1 Tax=Adiantum capillus-veneris TaxID=13818 RepID=A0A9D4ZME4_ADICA|nr:hypothetical protein GOP47_0007879 [Adiantum capillus-veneris]
MDGFLSTRVHKSATLLQSLGHQYNGAPQKIPSPSITWRLPLLMPSPPRGWPCSDGLAAHPLLAALLTSCSLIFQLSKPLRGRPCNPTLGPPPSPPVAPPS